MNTYEWRLTGRAGQTRWVRTRDPLMNAVADELLRRYNASARRRKETILHIAPGLVAGDVWHDDGNGRLTISGPRNGIGWVMAERRIAQQRATKPASAPGTGRAAR